MYNAKIIEDSLSPSGKRLTTFEVSFPRIVLAEFNTHRVFSRNSASSRAIPVTKTIQRVRQDPFVPVYWGKNQSGMQAKEELAYEDQQIAKIRWLTARDEAVKQAERFVEMGVHKQIVNRLLEPFMWHTVVVTATEWENFFALRCHPDAQPEIRVVAVMMRELYRDFFPIKREYGEWHLPFITASEVPDLLQKYEHIGFLKQISAGRCARVSYLTHDGKRDPDADIRLCAQLAENGHMSPLEHVAMAMPDGKAWSGNFQGWAQYRKEFHSENNFAGVDHE